MTEPTRTPISTIKTELTDVLTDTDLLSNISRTPEEFATVITDSSLLGSPPLTTPEDIVETYDNTFPTPDSYKNFVDIELAPWRNTMELKLFDTLYLHHRSTESTIRTLRHNAQKMLEQANVLQGQHQTQKEGLKHHLRSIARTGLKKKLLRPKTVYPRPPPPPVPVCREIPRQRSAPDRPPRRIIRCYQCNSTEHIKWYCTRYRCPGCDKISPGHAQHDCPGMRYDDGMRGHHDVYGEEDGNLTGEC